jgi:hypothetical protein
MPVNSRLESEFSQENEEGGGETYFLTNDMLSGYLSNLAVLYVFSAFTVKRHAASASCFLLAGSHVLT